ncbi:MAG: D-alanyl-D-alanine carboxypeptidase [Thermomicrobiales bacterium]
MLLLAAFLVPVLLGHQAVASPGWQTSVAMQVDPTAGPAWFAVDLTTGMTLYDDSGDTQLAPASTAKLVTVIAARRLLGVNEQVTIVESDMVDEEFSKMGLEPGDVVTVEQLLYGSLIPSGGDAARALARTCGVLLDPQAPDPIERFVQEMNAVAGSIGMASSSFGNPIGRDDDRSWTTARDLVRAGEIVLDDPLLASIVRTPWASMVIAGPNEREIVLENTNQFVLFDDAIGIKTGTTDAAGQNLMSAFQFGDHVVVTVVLGSADRYADTTAMLDSIRANWTWLTLGRDAASLGATDELAAQGLWMPVSRTILVPSDQVPSMTYDVVLGDGVMGLSDGSVTFKLSGAVLAELPVYPAGEPGSE